jgi:hypothetical protein
MAKLTKFFPGYPAGLQTSKAEALPEDASVSGDVDEDFTLSPFDIADDLERGFAAEAVLAKNASSPSMSRDPFRRCCIIHLQSPKDEYHLISETGDMLLTAKFLRRQGRIEFFLVADEQDALSSPDNSPRKSEPSTCRRQRPAFAMQYNEHNENWMLTQTICEHCAHRPKHLSCEFLGKSQQMAFIQHSMKTVVPAAASPREDFDATVGEESEDCKEKSPENNAKMYKATVHYVDVKIPALQEDSTMVWCPVALGRDLGERHPSYGVQRRASDSMLLAKRSTIRRSSGSCSPNRRSQTSQWPDDEAECPEAMQLYTKVPEWDDEVESLVLNFRNRVVQSSPMNFMVCAGERRLVLQHAKLSCNTFCLDFRHPLSTVQAFAVSLSALLWV